METPLCTLGQYTQQNLTPARLYCQTWGLGAPWLCLCIHTYYTVLLLENIAFLKPWSMALRSRERQNHTRHAAVIYIPQWEENQIKRQILTVLGSQRQIAVVSEASNSDWKVASMAARALRLFSARLNLGKSFLLPRPSFLPSFLAVAHHLAIQNEEGGGREGSPKSQLAKQATG